MPETTETKVAGIEVQMKSFERRISDIEESVKNFTGIMLSIQQLSDNIKVMSDNMESMNKRLAVIEQAPAEKWNVLTKQIMTALVSAVVGAIVTWAIALPK